MLTNHLIEKNNPIGNQSTPDQDPSFQALYEMEGIVYTVDFYTSDTKPDAIDKALDKLFSYTFQQIKEEENTKAGMV